MSISNSSRKSNRMGQRERFVWQAAMAAVLAHVLVLAALAEWGGLPPSGGTVYAEVDFADFVTPERTQTMEEAVRERMEARMEQVRNVTADASAQSSEEVRSSASEAERIARDVEAELRAFEQSAFDALSEGRNGASIAGTDAAVDEGKVENRFEGWDARHAGQVTAEFSLEGRKALYIDVPGYRCRGGGVVVVTIEVSPEGSVLQARVLSSSTSGGEAMAECLTSEALRSAGRCRFQAKAGAEKRQVGSLTYRFIAQ